MISTTTRKTLKACAVATATVGLLSACSTAPSPAELDAQFAAMMKASFRDQGIAKVDRIQQDLGQSACSSDEPLQNLALADRSSVKYC